jgi:hypothetical protein
MKRFLLLFFTLFTYAFCYSQGGAGPVQSCSSPIPEICNGSLYPAATSGTATAPSGTSLNCGFSAITQYGSFYFFESNTNGPLSINITPTDVIGIPYPNINTSPDLDYICWGPFNDLLTMCDLLTNPNQEDCSNAPATTQEVLQITNAVAGEFYVILVANWAATGSTPDPCFIQFTAAGPNDAFGGPSPGDAGADAGWGTPLLFCDTDPQMNLIDQLNGQPVNNGNWTYNGNPVPGTFDPAIDPPGIYTYSIAGSSSGTCPGDDATVTLDVFSASSISITSPSVLCSDENSFTLTGIPPAGWSTQGQGVFTDNLGSVITDFDPAISGIGNHNITYTYTPQGCNPIPVGGSILVNEAPAVLPANVATTNPSCFGYNDGTATVFPTGGTLPYDYNWYGQDSSLLPSGTFNYTITDANQCSFSSSVTLYDPLNTSSVINEYNSSCFGANDGAASITMLGATTPPGTISLLPYCLSNPAPGMSGQPSASIGEVQVLGDNFDINNNTLGLQDFYEDYTASMYADITEGQLYSVSVIPFDEFATTGQYAPEAVNVYIDFNIDGDFLDAGEDLGVINIPWGTWVPGTIYPFNFTVPTTGAYGATRMRVVCMGNAGGAAISMGPCEAALGFSTPWFGATEDYSIVLNAPSSSATISWYNGLDTDSISNLSPGTYSVLITVSGCPILDSAVITEPEQITFNPTITDISCNAFTDGAVTLNPSGGNGGAYNINWGGIDSSALGNGSYTVTVTDPSTITTENIIACFNDTLITLVEPGYFSVDFAVSDHSICAGDPIDLEFNFNSNGVPPFVLDYTDALGNPNTLNISNTPNPYLETVIPNTSGNYTITSIIDNDGCFATLVTPIQNVVVNPLPSISFNIPVPEMCIGETRSLNINNLTGASPLTVYYTITDISSSSSTSEIVGPGGTTISLSPSQTTTYSVYEIEDMNNCKNLIPFDQTLIVNELPQMQLTAPSEICDNDSAQIIINLSGNGPWNFQYSDYGSILPFNTVNTTDTIYLIMQNSDANVFISNFSDSKCPNTVNPETIISNPLPLVTLSGTGTSCADDGITDIDITVTNGNPPYTLYYTDGISNFSSFIASPHTITTTGPGTYVITNLIDYKSCKADLSLLNNTLISYETPQLTTTSPTEICDGDFATIDLEFTAGTPPYDVDYTFNSSNQTTTINFATGELNLIATNPSNITINSITGANCPNPINEDIQININSLPISTLSGDGEICDDGSFTYIKFETTSGLPLYDIVYTDGTDNFTLTNIGNIDSIPTSVTGAYTLVSVTDQKGCEAISLNGQANVNINPLPDVSIIAYPLITEITDPLINFIDKSTYLSLTPGIWDFGDGSGQISNFGQLDHMYTDTGVYHVSLTAVSNFGCINTAYQTIIINPTFTIYIPNAFTPNNDLDNDYFLPIVDGVKEYELSIYDRQGQRVFRTEEYTNEYCNSGCKAAWDGKINNSSDFGTIGVYVYHIVITDINGKLKSYEGALTLIR